jgi:seryl-tRNA synthetase
MLDTRVAILESDVGRMTSLFQKLEAAIGKIGDASNNIARILAVHEERLTKQNQTDEELFTLVENRRQEIQNDVKELHSRITTLSREVSEDINETEQRLIDAMNKGMGDVKKCITEETKIINSNAKNLEQRILELERWKWVILGGSVVAGMFANAIATSLIK